MTGRGRAAEDGLFWWLVLGALLAAALALLIWVGRDTLFSVDDLLWFMGSPGLDRNGLLQPHNGHLIAVPRLLYRATFELLGADYAAIRALTALSVGLSGALFYGWASRRIDRRVAIAGSALLILFGTSYIFLIAGDGLMLHLALSCGLGSLLALERDDRLGDALAAGLLCLGILTYSVALAFVVAAAASVLARPGARRRLWVPFLPALLYGAWWLWAQGNANATIDQGEISNLLTAPAYAVQSLASALGALTGLDYDFSVADPVRPEFETNATIFGPVLALVAAAALVWRLRRAPVTAALWTALALLVALWVLGALTADPASPPDASRFALPVSVGVLAVAAAAGAGIEWTRVRLIALWVVVACGLAANVVRLGEGGDFRRAFEGPRLRAELTAIELAGVRGRPPLDLSDVADGGAIANFPFALSPLRDPVGDYLDAVERYGRVGFGVAELRAQPEELRARTDSMLVGAFGAGLEPADPRAGGARCEEVGVAGSELGFELPRSGAILQSRGVSAPIELRRFAGATWAPVGELRSGDAVAIRPPDDQAPDPWHARVPGGAVAVCSP